MAQKMMVQFSRQEMQDLLAATKFRLCNDWHMNAEVEERYFKLRDYLSQQLEHTYR